MKGLRLPLKQLVEAVLAEKQTAKPKVTLSDRHQRNRRRLRILGKTVGITACVASMAVGTVAGHLYWNSETLRDFIGSRGIPGLLMDTLTGDPLANWTPEHQFPQQTAMNLLVLGVDKDYDNRGQIIKTANGRSDSILIAHIDFVDKTISALTIPRDSAVRIPGYRGFHKINAAHSLGGPDLAIETIKDVFGIDIDAYVSINFEGFQKVVDAIGGIDINVEKRLKYDDNWGNLHVNLFPGWQHLDGYQAMGYVRMRHSDNDIMRSQRQHAFLEAVRGKVKHPATFMRIPKAIDTLADMLKRGKITNDQLFAIANFARSLPRENINVQTLPSFEGPSYVTINGTKSAEMINQLFFGGRSVVPPLDTPDPNYAMSTRSRRAAKPSAKPPAVTVPLTVEEPTAEEPMPMDPPAVGTEDPSTTPPPVGPGATGDATERPANPGTTPTG